MEQKKSIITVSASVFIVLAVAVISIFLSGDEESVKLKKDTMQIEAGEEMEFHLSDYVVGSEEQLKEVKADTSDVDTDKPGDYKITITYKDREFLIRVSVKDTTPPILQGSGEVVEIMVGESVSVDGLGITVDDFSECELTFSDGEKTKIFETAGEVNEKIIAIDTYENKSQTEVSIRVLAVNVPEIYGEGLRNRTFYMEDGIDLLEGIEAWDAEDGNLTAQIQVSAPSLTTPGVKKVTYSVTDSDGHMVTQTVYLTVKSKEETPGNQPDIEQPDAQQPNTESSDTEQPDMNSFFGGGSDDSSDSDEDDHGNGDTQPQENGQYQLFAPIQ